MKKLLITFLAVSIFCTAGVILLISTETGFRWIMQAGAGLSGDTLRVGRVSGSILSNWKIEKLSIKSQLVHISVFECSGNLQPGRLLNKALRVGRLHGQGVEVRLQEQNNGGVKGQRMANSDISRLSLPFSVFLEKVEIDNLTLWDQDGAELAVIDRVSFGLETEFSTIKLSDFVLLAPGYGLELQASLDAGQQGSARITGNVTRLADDFGQLTGNIRIEGPLPRLAVEASLLTPFPLTVVGEVRNLLGTPTWQAEISTTGLQLTDEIVPLPGGVLVSGRATASGDLENYSASLEADADVPEIGNVDLGATFIGDFDGITVKEADIQTPLGRAVINETRMGWIDGLEWDGEALFSEIDPGAVDPLYSAELSAKVRTGGRYQAALPIQGYIVVDRLEGVLQGREIEGKGRVDVNNNVLDVSGLELVNGPSVLSVAGSVRMEHGLLNWQKPLGWDLVVSMDNFDPSIIAPEYPGRLNASLTSTGRLDGREVSADADILELNGSLREYPMSGSGKLRVRESVVELENFTLKSGNSQLTMQGNVNGQLDLSVALTSEDLGEVLAGGSGNLELRGNVGGTRELPVADIVLDIKDVSYEGLRVDTLHGHLSGSGGAQAEGVASITGAGIGFADINLQTVNIEAAGSATDHVLDFDLQAWESALSLKAQGSLEENTSWKGEVENMRVESPALGTWHQVGSVLMEVSEERAEGQDLCLAAGGENICFSGGWSAYGGEWKSDLKWQDINLDRLAALTGGAEKTAGRTDGSVKLTGNSEQISLGDARLHISDFQIGEEGRRGDWELFDIMELNLDMVLENETLKSDLVLTMKDGNKLTGYGVVPGVGGFAQDYGSLPLAGEFGIGAVNLDFVAPLTNYYVYPKGELKGEIQLSGTLLDPLASGELTLFNGRIEFPTFGVGLHDAIFKVVGQGNTLQLWGEGSSGPGRLYADGSLTFRKGDVDGEFNFVGQNIDSLNLPEYEIRTSPDLRLVFDSDGGSLVGELFVPQAMITPEKMTDSLSVSDDVVLLDEEEVKSANGWRFSTILEVDLGEDVQLDGYGLTGYLRGDLVVNKVPGMFMTGQGVLTLEDGLFSIYGRSLDIDRGRVVFSGGAIDDPGIDVRAQRVVADKVAGPNGILVGVDVSGTAEDLEFKLFSDPYMEESDILAYMVVGRSVSDTGSDEKNILSSAAMALGANRGTALLQDLTGFLPVDDVYFEGETSGEDERLSLVVGKKLTDELFIGYDHNFFDQVGEMTIRYELGKGFYIESRTSGDATGADLLFSFER